MNRKHLALLLAITLLLAICMTACNQVPASMQPSQGNQTSAQTGPAQTSTPVDTSREVRLVFAFPGNDQNDMMLVEEALSKYTKEKINATVELLRIDFNKDIWTTAINSMFAGSEQLDVIFTCSWWNYGIEISQGQLLDVEDLLDKYGVGIKASISTDVIDSGRVEGKLYAVTANKEFASTKGISMRKDLLDKYSLDIASIKKLEDLEPILEKIKKNEAGITPLVCRHDSSPVMTLFEYGLYDKLDDGYGVLDRSKKDLKVVDMFESQAFMDYAKLAHKWFEAGYINSDASTLQDNITDVIKAGKAFAHAVSMKPGFDAQDSRACGMPMVSVELVPSYMTTGDTTSAMLGITTISKEPERAMMFIDMLYSDSFALNTLDFGIEEKHYVKVEDKVIDYPEGVDASNSGYNLNQAWMFGNILNTYVWKGDDPNVWSLYKAFNDGAERSQALGFMFKPDNVKTEIAALNNKKDQYYRQIITGSVDPEQVIPEFVLKLKEAGIDKVIAEKQSQLDAWAKANSK